MTVLRQLLTSIQSLFHIPKSTVNLWMAALQMLEMEANTPVP